MELYPPPPKKKEQINLKLNRKQLILPNFIFDHDCYSPFLVYLLFSVRIDYLVNKLFLYDMFTTMNTESLYFLKLNLFLL